LIYYLIPDLSRLDPAARPPIELSNAFRPTIRVERTKSPASMSSAQPAERPVALMLMKAGVNLLVAFAGAGVISRGETPQLGWNPQYR